ncbi:hypothetical protein AYK59_11245 [Pseudomonas synxantha]|uniref:Uncharacterized protein n=1 Tax=Pseudomonas synxantha TaxID=47883 RepID=A0A3G7U2U2_9PSED|nr:hypothetical protein [Pseudomonas synxantha]AMS20681.1 hypothetical protein AYK59_11245 [Pseudomonas synxantha]AZE53694.1 hypothetical protein C4K03_1523 [Pseudomonas synxantha]
MSQEGEDLSAGESSINSKMLDRYLKKEIWRYSWEQGLAKLAICLILGFYTVLLGFIFLGHFRLVIGKWYFFLSTKPHVVTDVPIILALSSIPTILLIALLRYFHHREKSGIDSDTPLPLSLQSSKDLMDMLNKSQ